MVGSDKRSAVRVVRRVKGRNASVVGFDAVDVQIVERRETFDDVAKQTFELFGRCGRRFGACRFADRAGRVARKLRERFESLFDETRRLVRRAGLLGIAFKNATVDVPALKHAPG